MGARGAIQRPLTALITANDLRTAHPGCPSLDPPHPWKLTVLSHPRPRHGTNTLAQEARILAALPSLHLPVHPSSASTLSSPSRAPLFRATGRGTTSKLPFVLYRLSSYCLTRRNDVVFTVLSPLSTFILFPLEPFPRLRPSLTTAQSGAIGRRACRKILPPFAARALTVVQNTAAPAAHQKGWFRYSSQNPCPSPSSWSRSRSCAAHPVVNPCWILSTSSPPNPHLSGFGWAGSGTQAWPRNLSNSPVLSWDRRKETRRSV